MSYSLAIVLQFLFACSHKSTVMLFLTPPLIPFRYPFHYLVQHLYIPHIFYNSKPIRSFRNPTRSSSHSKTSPLTSPSNSHSLLPFLPFPPSPPIHISSSSYFPCHSSSCLVLPPLPPLLPLIKQWHLLVSTVHRMQR